MGLIFVITNTKSGSESFKLFYHMEGCQLGSHLEQAFQEKAEDWNKARTQWVISGFKKNQSNQGRLYFVLYLGCVISAFPSRGNRRVRSGPSGAVQH